MDQSKTNSLKTHTYTSLSIQVRLDGLSFFTQNPATGEVGVYDVVRFRESVDPSNLVPSIEGAFIKHPALSKSFMDVTIVYDNDLCTVVPQKLFKRDSASDYLKFNTKILRTDFVAYDELDELDKVIVYIPYANVNNYFFDRFGSFEYYHSTTLFLKELYRKVSPNDTARVFAYLKKGSFDLAVIQKNKLLLINTFNTTTTEDFLYYLLFAYEQLGLDTNEIPLDLMGDINKEHAIYQSAYTYVRHCTIAEQSSPIIDTQDTLLATLL